MNLRRAMLPGRPALAFLEGPPSGPPLLFLHGLGRSSEDIEPLAMPLSGQWQVKALDFRGHGGSDRVPGGYHVADYVQDAVRFLEQREPGPGPVVLHGHSLGAMVALAVAAELPSAVRGLVLEDPPFHTMGRRIAETPWRGLFVGLRAVGRQTCSLDARAEALAEIPVRKGEGCVRLGALRSAESIRFSARCLAQIDPEIYDCVIDGRWLDGYDEKQLFRQVRCPALFLQADPAAGGALTDEDVACALSVNPNFRSLRFPGAGHVLHWEQPGAVLRAIADFSARLPALSFLT